MPRPRPASSVSTAQVPPAPIAKTTVQNPAPSAPNSLSDPATPQPERAKRPAHERTYFDLRDMILFGDLLPGQPVTIQGLTNLLNTGMTPVREAIRRLTSEGALILHGNRRISVPILSEPDIKDIVFIRKSIETELVRRATVSITPAQINILQGIDTALDAAISTGNIRAYLRHNYEFHITLNAIANAPVLAEVVNRLWLRFGPSLRVVCGRLGTQNLPDWHKDILSGLRARDPDLVADATTSDLEQGMVQVLAELNLPSQHGQSPAHR